MLATVPSRELSEWIAFFALEHEEHERARMDAEVNAQARDARIRAAHGG